MTSYPPGVIRTWGINQAMTNQNAWISYVGVDGSIFNLAGPLAPVAGAQDGVVLVKHMGLMAPFENLELRGARQDGATWTDAVYDAAEILLSVEASGISPQNIRNVVRQWISAWDPMQVGKLSVYTPDFGEWWANVRLSKNISDVFTKDYTWSGRQPFTWTCKNYDAFWYGVDSVSQFDSTSTSPFLPLTNVGDQPAWPRYLCYGPGTFSFGNGPGSQNMVTFGPLVDGQIVLITTLPRLRSVVDLSPAQPPQKLTQFQTLISDLISFATNGNVPPFLQQFESWFGILPPQGNLYSLLKGRFTYPIPATPYGIGPVTKYIPVSITGGNSNSKVVAAVTPMRRWPL